MSELKPILDYLYGLQTVGVKMGLENIQFLMDTLGQPHRKGPVIHVAGTNGKGSTCAMMESIFRAAGYKTGLYTSPHIRRFNERIRVNGTEISDEAIVGITELLKPHIDARSCTFFEATTAMAFHYFAEKHVDVAIIETGLGGRLDATNVVTPELSVITSIGVDHTEYLGKTIETIAAEKAGIIKDQVPVLIGKVSPEANRVLRDTAVEKHAPVYFYDEIIVTDHAELSAVDTHADLTVNFRGQRHPLPGLKIGLAGGHQIHNAAMAAAGALIQKKIPINPSAIRLGLQSVQWPGRFQTLQTEPLVIADAAHNAQGLAALRDAVTALFPKKTKRLVIGMLSDKDWNAAVSILAPVFDDVLAVTPAHERGLSAGKLAEAFQTAGKKAAAFDSVRAGLTAAKEKTKPDELIVITGSFYVLSELESIV